MPRNKRRVKPLLHDLHTPQAGAQLERSAKSKKSYVIALAMNPHFQMVLFSRADLLTGLPSDV